MERVELPERDRITWLVGPPGAGKSTFAALHEHGFKRVVELTSMLGPLVNPPGITDGVLTANSTLVELIRTLELRDNNRGLDSVLVVAGIVPKTSVLPVREHERVWLLHPPRDRWQEQLHRRPTAGNQYSDYRYATLWYERFEAWKEEPGVELLSLPFEPGMIGEVCRSPSSSE